MKPSTDKYSINQFGTIYCIGRNYARHVAEMKSEILDEPVVFLKPRTSVIFNEQSIIIPEISKNVHHEVEMVLQIGKKTDNVSTVTALDSVKSIAVGLDITARDLQSEAKKAGLPWSLSKGFKTFAPVGNFVNYDKEIDLLNLDINVKVNGETRQSGNTSMMLFSAVQIISYLSYHFTLFPGDLIFTGTPEGVSQIHPGDLIEASLGNQLSVLKVYVQS